MELQPTFVDAPVSTTGMFSNYIMPPLRIFEEALNNGYSC